MRHFCIIFKWDKIFLEKHMSILCHTQVVRDREIMRDCYYCSSVAPRPPSHPASPTCSSLWIYHFDLFLRHAENFFVDVCYGPCSKSKRWLLWSTLVQPYINLHQRGQFGRFCDITAWFEAHTMAIICHITPLLLTPKAIDKTQSRASCWIITDSI